jgi:four helix bundle protein
MKSRTIEEDLVLKLAFEFSLELISYCEILENKKRFIVAGQLLKAGTSIGANCFEAQNAESKADFIHKFKIVAKESEETKYWLLLCKYSKEYPDCTALLEKADNLNKLIGKILSTSIRKHFFSYLLSSLYV